MYNQVGVGAAHRVMERTKVPRKRIINNALESRLLSNFFVEPSLNDPETTRHLSGSLFLLSQSSWIHKEALRLYRIESPKEKRQHNINAAVETISRLLALIHSGSRPDYFGGYRSMAKLIGRDLSTVARWMPVIYTHCPMVKRTFAGSYRSSTLPGYKYKSTPAAYAISLSGWKKVRNKKLKKPRIKSPSMMSKTIKLDEDDTYTSVCSTYTPHKNNSRPEDILCSSKEYIKVSVSEQEQVSKTSEYCFYDYFKNKKQRENYDIFGSDVGVSNVIVKYFTNSEWEEPTKKQLKWLKDLDIFHKREISLKEAWRLLRHNDTVFEKECEILNPTSSENDPTPISPSTVATPHVLDFDKDYWAGGLKKVLPIYGLQATLAKHPEKKQEIGRILGQWKQDNSDYWRYWKSVKGYW